MKYLEVIVKLIVNTRDIFNGKGEHDLFYTMMHELHNYFPVLSVFLLNNLTSFGCWRDIKYLCNYVREKSGNDSLIRHCVSIVNKQLKKDIESWKYSVNAGSRNHISNVAKWIPREKKRFLWLFDMLATDWSNKYGHWKISDISIDNDNEGPRYQRALSKVRMEYRKIISKMNKNLDTTEIKLCSRHISEINPQKVSKYTIMKQPRLFLSVYTSLNLLDIETNPYDVFDRVNCSYNYVENIMKENSATALINGSHTITQLPISHFIKEAFRINKIVNQDINVRESNLLNKKWELFTTNYYYKYDNLLPIVDLSYEMLSFDEESFYHSIGLAILASEKSYFGKRIISFDNLPCLINFSDCSGLCSIIKIIYENIYSQKNTAFSFEKGIDFIAEVLSESEAVVRNMKLLIFSNSLLNKIDGFYEYLEKKCNRLTISVPHIIFWNMSKTHICELPTCYKNISLLSGFTRSPLKHINKTVLQKDDPNYSYELITGILGDGRYDFLSDFLKKHIY
jgi:hypothetical protein